MMCNFNTIGEADHCGHIRHRCCVCGYETAYVPNRGQRVYRECVLPGVGDHLKQLIEAKRLTPPEGCSCESMVRKMNEWGPAGCREYREEIIGTLQDHAAEVGWFVMGRAAVSLLQERWFNPLDRFGCFVDEAIRRTEENHFSRISV